MSKAKFAADVLAGRRPLADALEILDHKARMRRRQVHLELTSRCNLSCKACYRSGPLREDMATNLVMSMDDVGRVLDAYRPSEVRSFSLSGGENLLHPDFFPIVHVIGRRFPSCDISLATNGIVLAKSESQLEGLCRSEVSSVLFSLHGARQETISLLQGGIPLFRVLDAAQYILEKSHIHDVSVSFVIQEENVDEMTEFVELVASKTSVEHIVFMPMNFAGHSEGAFDYESLWREMGLWEKLDRACERAREVGIRVTPVRNLCGCMGPVDVLTADGSMLLCWGNYLVKRYAIGNVLRERPSDIRNKPQFRTLRKTLKAGGKPEMCAACWMKGVTLPPQAGLN